MEFFARLLDKAMNLRLNYYEVHGLAILIVGVALGVHKLLHPLVSGVVPFAAFFPAILLSALIGGTAVGVTAWLFAGLASWWFFLPSNSGLNASEIVSLGMYSGMVLVLLIVAHALRTATMRYRALVTTSAAHAREECLRLFVESDIIGILHEDIHGHIFKANKEFLRIIGYTEEDVEAGLVPWDELTPPEWRSLDADRIADAQTRGACTRYEKEFIRKDGTRVPVLISYILPDAEHERVLAFVLDLTDQKRALAFLHESETRFRSIVDSAPVPIWIGNKDGIEFCNKACLTTYGHSLEEMMGRNWVKFLHPDDREAYLSVSYAAESERKPMFVEGRLQNGRGEWRWIRSTAFPRFSIDGQYQGYTGSTIDITDEKRVEIELRRTNELLEERVTARTGELEDANRQLMMEITEREKAEAQLRQAQKMEAMGQLTGGVAHDFNNLLTVVLGNAEMLERMVDRADDQRLKRLLNSIRHAAEQGAQLTRQLLAFARRQPLRPEAIKLQDRLQGMSQLIARSLRPDINLSWDLSEYLWPVQVDPTQLELAVLNIAVNARDAMPKGGVIRIAAENCVIGIHDNSDISPGSYVRLAIIDTGEGISPEILPRVFEPFFTTKDMGKGSGLGLSQVYGFARQSGGTIHITSESGQGTTVALLLPRAHTEPVRLPAPEITPAQTEHGDLLVVEDDSAVAEIVSEMLMTLGYNMTRVHSAEEALSVLGNGSRFDLVFSDVLMPGTMSGIGLASEIRQQYPQLPVLLTTGYSDAINDALADGFHVLPKPYRATALMKAIRTCLELQPARQAERNSCR